ncbi:MAG: hypothetical protein FJX75_08045 [Armatimonadetes bacterium]|nr:hypothetical protein [Armatimonadota bacterium]
MHATLALLALTVAPCSAEDALDRALAQVGLTKATAHIDAADSALFTTTEFELPLFRAIQADPFKAPAYTEALGRGTLEAAPTLLSLVTQASQRVGAVVRRAWLEDPHAEMAKALDGQQSPLAYAIGVLGEWAGQPLTAEQRAAVEEQAKVVPLEIARQAAFLILAARDAERWRQLAFRGHGNRFPETDTGNDAKILPFDLGVGEPPSFDERMYAFLHTVDLPFLFAGAGDLASAVDKALKALESFSTDQAFTFRHDSPLGAVILRGAGQDELPADAKALLLIDCGGDDTYRTGAVAGPDHPESILIDLAGNDTYECADAEACAFGAGVMGYAYLVDRSGEDVYRGGRAGQGAGLIGVGALLDMAGNDRYEGREHTQGAAQVGAGILSDLAGDDRYDCYSYGQGYGSTLGCGVLVDVAGADTYTANDTDIVNPSPQTKEHNVSMAQGCGYGRRADYTDGHSLGGGVGLLVDGGGNDRYSCGVFGQGVGYWAGVGVLLDFEGNDEYKGVWYVQGSCAHFAVGVLQDFAGNDVYAATHNMAQGAGHDFSVGLLIEGGGDDTYTAPNLSLGGGNANGIGILWERGGKDTYNVAAGTTLGRANAESQAGSLRSHIPCLGLFVDEAGDDTYPAAVQSAGNGKLWTQGGAGEAAIGVGLDTP